MSEKEKPQSNGAAEEKGQQKAVPAKSAPSDQKRGGNEKKATPKPRAGAPSNGRRGGSAAVALGILALLLAAIAGGGAYYVWFQQQELTRSAAEARSNLTARLQELGSAQERLRTSLEDDDRKLAATTERQDALEHKVQRLEAQLGQDHGGWIVAETEYLLRIGNRRLQLAHDVNGAIVALDAADQRLKSLADPAYLEVRRTIARELEALRAVNQPDIAGLALKLSSLAEATADLPLVNPYRGRQPAAPTETAEKPTGLSDWRGLVATVWKEIKSLVTIRREGAKVQPLLPPDQRYFLQQNLRLKLEAARVALLEGDAGIYRDSLGKAIDWIRRYYDTDSAPVSSFLQTAQQLEQTEITMELPDISGSLRTLLKVSQRLAEQSEAGGTGQ